LLSRTVLDLEVALVEDQVSRDRFAAVLPPDLKATARRVLGGSGGVMVVTLLRPVPISSVTENGEAESPAQVAAVTIPGKDPDFDLWLQTQMPEDLETVTSQLVDQMKKRNRD
jgi:hypothetical protein